MDEAEKLIRFHLRLSDSPPKRFLKKRGSIPQNSIKLNLY